MSEESEMSEESDDPDSSSSRQKILTLAGMGLCAVQFAFFAVSYTHLDVYKRQD